MFNCSFCNYKTENQWNFKRHCSTQRHHKNKKRGITNSNNSIMNSNNLITNSNNSITNSNNSITKCNYYKCDYCNANFKRIDNYNKHLTKCCKRLLCKIQDNGCEPPIAFAIHITSGLIFEC